MQPADANAHMSYARVLCALGTSRVMLLFVLCAFLRFCWIVFCLKLLQLLVFLSPYQAYNCITTILFIATLILKRCHPGRSSECETEFSRAKSAAVKSKGKKAAGTVYLEHAMSLKRAGQDAAMNQLADSRTSVSPPTHMSNREYR
jgi:hypothetical protein